MKMYVYVGLVFVLMHGGLGIAGPPVATRSSPHEWECTYAFSDTTCREMIFFQKVQLTLHYPLAIRFRNVRRVSQKSS